MSDELAAQALGLTIDEVSLETKIRHEKRYCIIIHLLRNNKAYVGANRVPDTIKRAKKIALKELATHVKKVKKDDVISVKGLEVEYADVPVNTVLRGMSYELQVVSNRWLTPEELTKLGN